MPTIIEVEELAFNLSEGQRAVLVSPVLHDEDEGLAEARRRDAELEVNLAAGISLEQPDH